MSKEIIELPKGFEPTAANVQRICNEWNKSSDRIIEQALDNLFTKVFPSNSKIEEVVIKIAALDDLYATQLLRGNHLGEETYQKGIEKFADGIAKLDLKKGSFKSDDLIDTIRNLGKANNFSFATKFCAFHNPDFYPIYDSQADKALWCLKKRDSLSEFLRKGLKDFKTYKRVIDEFKIHYNLEKFSYREIDHYLWRLGDLI